MRTSKDGQTADLRISPSQSPKSSLYTQNRRISPHTSQGRWIAYRRQGDEMRRKIIEHVTSKGCLYKSELDEWMRSQGMAKNTAQSIYSDMVKSMELVKVT